MKDTDKVKTELLEYIRTTPFEQIHKELKECGLELNEEDTVYRFADEIDVGLRSLNTFQLSRVAWWEFMIKYSEVYAKAFNRFYVSIMQGKIGKIAYRDGVDQLKNERNK